MREVNIQAQSVGKLCGSIRNHINTHRYQQPLLEDLDNWNQICASIDVIEDSTLGIYSYSELDYPDNEGQKYLMLYGVLQSMYLQQDACIHLTEAFGTSYELSNRLLDIRYLRNSSIGHPTKEGVKKQTYYNFISRISIEKAGFDLLRYTELQPHATVSVDLASMLEDQLAGSIQCLTELDNHLMEKDRQHKEKHGSTKVVDLFPSATSYFFEKIGQGIRSDSPGERSFGLANVTVVRDIFEQFRSTLQERSELHEYTTYDLTEYFFALGKVEEFLSNGGGEEAQRSAGIFLYFLREELARYVQIAEEIDREYEINH